MARTTTRKTTANKTTPRKATAKKAPAARKTAATARGTVVDLRHPLPVRRRNFTGPYTPAQIAEARAALASAMAQLPVPSLLWLAQPDGRAAARLADGTLLIHTHAIGPEFDAHIPCPHGAHHQHYITSARDLAEARATTRACRTSHTEPTRDGDTRLDWDHAITRPNTPTRPALTGVVVQLREGVRRARALDDDTESMSLTALATALDETKEHPQP